jgi:undecaprenyl-phosphate 4-deoxy-4-formamido-L-arabinose transferase
VISIIIPLFNSEASIYRLCSDIINSLVDQPSDEVLSFEFVLVNDCSVDGTLKECHKLKQEFPNFISFYDLASNVGEHNAVMAGLTQCKGDWAIIIDDDFQNPVSEILKLINFSVNNEYDVVFTRYKEKKHSLFRNFGSFINDKAANFVLNKPSNLYLSSFKAINRFLINQVIKYKGPFAYLDGLVLDATQNIGVIDVTHNARAEGESGYTLKKLMQLWSNMFFNFSILPLRISIFFGLITSLVAFAFGVYSFIESFIDSELPPGYSSTIIILLFAFGILQISIGIVGEYIGRIFISNNGKPQFIIRSKNK